MRLALLQSFLPSRSQGGVGHFTHQFACRLVARGHAVTVFSLDPAPADAAYTVVQPMGAPWYLRGRLGRLYGFAWWLARQRYEAFDVVHALGDNHLLRTSAPVVRTLSGCALAEAWYARKPTTRAMQASLYPLELVGAARAQAAVGISRGALRFFPWVRTVIPQGIDRRVFTPGGEKSGVPSILGVGHRLHDRKRLDLLVAAFLQHVQPALPDAQLWLVCDDRLELPGVRCYANLPLAELAALYRRAWVFCLPSSYEGFGRPYAEALASGTPVVATPNAGAREVLGDGRWGVIVPPARLAPALLALLRDEPARAQLTAAGLARAAAFDWERVVAAYEALYERLVARPARRGVASVPTTIS
ncbi:MAG TPA: glycosyltransferase family 4 protein [Chloroflexota bacterium]|jgi:phosphatidylinositol alpha-mannosyltransferase|nr:glycosyltransferase family 4 protein [Chloroflexota bacterium]